MQVLPVSKHNNYLQNQEKQIVNSNTSFKGRVGKTVYSHVKEVKRKLGRESLKYHNDISKRLDAVNMSLKALEDFAEKLHSKSRIQMYISEHKYMKCFYNSIYSTVFLQDNNKLLKRSQILRVDDIDNSSYSDYNFVNAVKNFLKYQTPEDQNAEIFNQKRKDRLDNYLSNMSFNFIERFILRQRAKRFDKLAPEFNSNADALKMVNDRFKKIDKVNDIIKD